MVLGLPRKARWGHDALVEIRDTRYARAADGAYIAYQTAGDGPVDIAWQLDWFGNVDVIWEDPNHSTEFAAASRFSRIILHDRRGTGLSSRNVPPPSLEMRVSDLLCVLDAVGSSRPVLYGGRESGSPNALLAATDPGRVRSMVVRAHGEIRVGPGLSVGARPEYVDLDQRALESWGTAEYGQAFLDVEAASGHLVDEREALGLGGLLSRHTATPDVAKELSRIWYETDVREVLQLVHIPTLLIAFEGIPEDVAEAQHVAGLIPGAELAVLPGNELTEDFDAFADLIRTFIGVDRPVDLDSVLSTVLITDIVGSTERQAALGNHGWKGLVERHHAIVRETLRRYRGVENDTAGDGFFATFDGPARAIRCAQEVSGRVRDLGIEIRVGIHTGECEFINDKIGGIAVTIGARISAMAGPSEILISQTVKDLVAGSGLAFEDGGEHQLKGIPDRWHLYRVLD
jgi:class 3 adenylate cyclase/pimeloyl-ACP methyl ester carboxylesterase